MAPRGHLADPRRGDRLRDRHPAGRTSGSSHGAGRAEPWSSCAPHRSSTATPRSPRWRACSAGRPWCWCRGSSRTRSGGRSAAQGQRAGDHRRRDGAAADRGLPRGQLRRLVPAGPVLQRRALLARGQGRLRGGAAARRRHGGDRVHRDGLRGPGLRPGRCGAARGTDRDPGARRHRAGSGQPPGAARRGRPAGPGRSRPARLLQGPGQDRGDARRGGRETVRRARRLGAGRGRRLRDAARPRQHLRELPAARRSSPRRWRAR